MSTQPTDPEKRNRHARHIWLAAVSVGLVHIVLGIWLGYLAPEAEPYESQPIFIVDLLAPQVVEPPVSEAEPIAPKAGGGAPAAPSIVHSPPAPPKITQPEITAPPEPAQEQPLVVGVATEATQNPGTGQGGSGTGIGSGQGSGSGDGAGSGPRLVRGPSQAELRSIHPREAFRRRQGGRVELNCRIRIDTRLERCTVVDESPEGLGFGQAALAASQYFRFEPPTRGGQPVSGTSVRVGVVWP